MFVLMWLLERIRTASMGYGGINNLKQYQIVMAQNLTLDSLRQRGKLKRESEQYLGYLNYCNFLIGKQAVALRWRHNGCDGVSNHQPHYCLLNRLFKRGSKKTSKVRVTGLCEGNSPGTGEFPTQRISNAENVSIWWRYHGVPIPGDKNIWITRNAFSNKKQIIKASDQ